MYQDYLPVLRYLGHDSVSLDCVADVDWLYVASFLLYLLTLTATILDFQTDLSMCNIITMMSMSTA
jgi:hypothetical protein